MYSKLEEALEEFDFYTVKHIMELMNWRYAGIEGTPKVSDMKNMIRQTYSHAREDLLRTGESSYTLSCGGFEVVCYPDTSFDIKFVPVWFTSD